jgi:phosphohistidine phosphatase
MSRYAEFRCAPPGHVWRASTHGARSRMNCYLMRHGEAVDASVDRTRPLTSSGREDVERTAQLAAAKAVRVQTIYHSGILRAAQTAEIIAVRLACDAVVLPMSGLQPEDDPHVAAAELAVAGTPMMLVGHLPHLNRLAGLLGGPSCSNKTNFVPAMMACYRRDGGVWRLDWTIVPG